MNVRLDFDDVIDELGLTQSQGQALAENVLQRVTVLVAETWKNVAAKNLHRTRREYIQGITVIEEGRLKNAIVLFGELNNMMESGAAPFDMKKGLLASAKVKYDVKGNKYITVPFRLATPGSVGEGVGFSGVMPREIYTAFQKHRKATGSNRLGQKDLPASHAGIQTRPFIASTPTTPAYQAYKHKSSIYAGLTQTGRKGHHQYHTFRRVSSKSDPNAFIHGGFEAKNFAAQTIREANIDNAVEVFVDDFVAQY